MKFQEAKDKLKELAKGKYHNLAFSLTEDSSGEIETSCSIYLGTEKIGHGISTNAPTWEQAFALVEAQLIHSSIEETPEI
jgi:hypothetical protein